VKIIENIYNKCPIIIQNSLVSLYGLELQIMRHGKIFGNICKEIRPHLTWDIGEIEEYQIRELKKIIHTAVNYTDYYGELFKRTKLSVSDIKTLDDLEKIPILNKEEIRKNPTRFINKKYKISKLYKVYTTGTTGTPLEIYCDHTVRKANYAFYQRFLEMGGIDYKKKRITIGGRVIVPHGQNRPPFWRYSFFQKNLLFSSYHIERRNILAFVHKMKDFEPHYIDAYPSSLFALANYINELGINCLNITDGITTSAETLYSEQRDLIERTFGTKILDQYGAAEMCVFIGQCKNGSYHIHPDFAIVEFVNTDGMKAEPGEKAEIICTGFINHIMLSTGR